MKIGIFDSGIGGLTTLAEIIKLLPCAQYIYYADNKNAFFGEKTKEQITRFSRDAVNFLKAAGCSLIVFACNTATAAAIDTLRTETALPLIGTEPAVKPALICDKKAVVLATPFTAASERLKALSRDTGAIIVKAEGLADEIERKILTDPIKLDNDLTRLLSPYTFKSLVLGCTHFSYLKDNLARLYPQAEVFDGNNGVARRVAALAAPSASACGELFFHFTAASEQENYILLLTHVFGNFPGKKLALEAKML